MINLVQEDGTPSIIKSLFMIFQSDEQGLMITCSQCLGLLCEDTQPIIYSAFSAYYT